MRPRRCGIRKGPHRRRHAERLYGGSLAVDGGALSPGDHRHRRSTGPRDLRLRRRRQGRHQDPGRALGDRHDARTSSTPGRSTAVAETAGEFHNLDITIDELFLKERTTASCTGFDGSAGGRWTCSAWLTAVVSPSMWSDWPPITVCGPRHLGARRRLRHPRVARPLGVTPTPPRRGE